MNDEFLKQFRDDPRPEFARGLYRKLKALGEDQDKMAKRHFMPRWTPAFAGLGALALFVAMVSIPSVRAAAQNFLDLFRVRKFAAVPLDPDRIARLQAGKIDIEALLADSLEVTKAPGEPVEVDSAERAAEMAGIPLLLPHTPDAEPPKVVVVGDRAARFTANVERLEGLAEALGVDDVSIPQSLDGATVTLNSPSHVVMRYQTNGNWKMTFIQSRSPEITLPEGVDLAQLGEIGLRMTGMSRDEAAQFARTIDWNGTLLVPVPTNVASFHDVTVRGAQGLLITVDSRRLPPGSNAQSDSPKSMVLWSENGMVYSLSGPMSSVDLLEIANTVN